MHSKVIEKFYILVHACFWCIYQMTNAVEAIAQSAEVGSGIHRLQGGKTPPTSVIDMTLNNLMVRFH